MRSVHGMIRLAVGAAVGLTGIALSMGAVAGDPPGSTGTKPAGGAGKAAGTSVAVVELFTSEGCSSCPSADRVASKLASEVAGVGAAKPDPDHRVIILAFHVDYWDRLGWPDRFASSTFSERQRNYAGSLQDRGGGGVYTPQMVVNGKRGFVGSDEGRARSEIATALRTPAPTLVEATSESLAGGKVEVRVKAKGADGELARGLVVHAAVVESGLSTAVKRGENAGENLKHDRVVRAFEGAALDTAGQATLSLKPPADVVRGNGRIVVYVQKGETGEVVGASEMGLPALAAGK